MVALCPCPARPQEAAAAAHGPQAPTWPEDPWSSSAEDACEREKHGLKTFQVFIQSANKGVLGADSHHAHLGYPQLPRTHRSRDDTPHGAFGNDSQSPPPSGPARLQRALREQLLVASHPFTFGPTCPTPVLVRLSTWGPGTPTTRGSNDTLRAQRSRNVDPRTFTILMNLQFLECSEAVVCQMMPHSALSVSETSA